MDSKVATSVTMGSSLKAISIAGVADRSRFWRNHLSLSIEFQSSTGVRENHIGCFLGDQIHGRSDEESRDARKHRGVDHAKPGRIVNAKVAAQHAAVFARTDRTRAARVMPPRMLTDKLLEFGV